MIMRFWVILAFALAISGEAFAAANTQLNITVNPAAVTASGISCTAVAASFQAPVAAGTTVATCAVQPSGWAGSLALSGADAASFAVSGMNITVGSAALNPTTTKTYVMTVTASP